MLTSVRVAVFSAARKNCRRMSSNLKKIDRSKFPVIDEVDLDEKFICGWGPGGQNVNKAVNCCQLKHKPTGIVIKVHQSRKLSENRRIARELMAAKLDDLVNGEDSVANQKRRNDLHKIATKDAYAEKKREMKRQYQQLLAEEGAQKGA